MTARTVRFVFVVLVLAAIALVGAMASTGGSASAAKPAPPAVKWGVSAQPTCQRIVDAGYAPHDYVLWGGSWRYQPEWAGANTVRMSWLWRSSPACLIGARALPPAPVVVQPVIHDPAPVVVQPIIHDPAPVVVQPNKPQPVPVVVRQIIEEPEEVVEQREEVVVRQAQNQGPSDGETRLVTHGQYAGRYERYYADGDFWDVVDRFAGGTCPNSATVSNPHE